MTLVTGKATPAQQCELMLDFTSCPLPSATPSNPDNLLHYDDDDLLEMCKLLNDHKTEEEEKILPSFAPCSPRPSRSRCPLETHDH